MTLKSRIFHLKSQFNQGFTLIELLVVIAIIGILATLMLVNLQGARERARDSRRKADLNALQSALRLYYSDNQAFPVSSSYAITSAPWGGPFQSPAGTVYMSSLPLDPSSTATSPITYEYNSAAGAIYCLVAKLENASDSSIADSQTRCPISYALYPNKDTDADYVVCEE